MILSYNPKRKKSTATDKGQVRGDEENKDVADKVDQGENHVGQIGQPSEGQESPSLPQGQSEHSQETQGYAHQAELVP